MAIIHKLKTWLIISSSYPSISSKLRSWDLQVISRCGEVALALPHSPPPNQRTIWKSALGYKCLHPSFDWKAINRYLWYIMAWNIFKWTLLKNKVHWLWFHKTSEYIESSKASLVGFFFSVNWGLLLPKTSCCIYGWKDSSPFQTPARKHLKDKWCIRLLYKWHCAYIPL